jgi:hypothetical protein
MLKPAYSDAFGHFATRSLNGATKLVITESGAAALTEPKAVVYPRQAVRWRLLGESLIADSLRIVATHSHSGDAGIRRGRLSVASLEEQLAHIHPDHHAASLRRHVLWLLKQGFLAEQPRSAPAGNL